jgi:hypothetical protein
MFGGTRSQERSSSHKDQANFVVDDSSSVGMNATVQ